LHAKEKSSFWFFFSTFFFHCHESSSSRLCEILFHIFMGFYIVSFFHLSYFHLSFCFDCVPFCRVSTDSSISKHFKKLYFVKKYFFSSQILPQNHRSMQITKDIKYKVSSKKENCVWMWNNVEKNEQRKHFLLLIIKVTVSGRWNRFFIQKNKNKNLGYLHFYLNF
jgi:hypothetical protein